ncbi:MBL fold metallo-hydrolase [Curvibacter sp. CHRR-16]|uniref:MBL fold metallo-hydrolase n=1 Tax=Curvibacter sp. CHRR-16 TaxID=2835872 RepID=UPI002023B678|nr:MBL fold metallo-hydrolase [Curvibacter sp. CHRR-16]
MLFSPIQTAVPQQLHPLVWRLTAPNPGLMTGPGTNSYVVGVPGQDCVVVDPGPADVGHVHRLWDLATQWGAAPQAIRAIVCTHSHPDHAPGAWLLQQRYQEFANSQPQHATTPPVLGLPSGPNARADSQFTPNVVLSNKELVQLTRCTLQAIHTPGHASNHLCLHVLGEGLLLTGDHVLHGSTTVVAPPDGDMTAYLHSLRTVLALCDSENRPIGPGTVHTLLPAHGPAIAAAAEYLTTLLAHRLGREAKVAAAMRALPHGGLDDWLPLVYDDVPPGLWPIARLSLHAHVLRLQSQT